MREQLRGLGVVLRATAMADRRLMAGTFLLAFVNPLIWCSYMLVLRTLTDAVVRGDARGTLPLVLLLGVLMAAWPVWWRSMASFATTLHERTGHEFERRLIADAVRSPGLAQHESPDYLDQLTLLRAQMRDLGNPFAMVRVLAGVVLLAVSVVLLVTIDPLCGLLLCFALPSVLLSTRVERRRVAGEEAVVDAQRLRRRLFELLTEPGAAKEVKVLGLDAELRRRHRAGWAASIRVGDRVDVCGAALLSAGWAIFAIGLTGALWLLVWRASRGEVSAGDVILFVLASQALTGQVADVLASFGALQRMLSAAARYRRVERFARTARERPGALLRRPVPPRVERAIALERVSFAYPGSETPALADVSLELPAGTTIAFVGDNGAGKSTLVKLLCRLYEPTQGRIALDGQDIAAFDVDDWRMRLSAGFQDFVRFELAARESVGVGDLPSIASDPVIRRALADAGATKLEQMLPQGLETQLGSRWPSGVDLSGGQWQRLALARGFMRPSPLLLVLDEPTASLDAATEHQLFSRFASAARSSAAKRAITLFVSHRFSTVRTADLIVVVREGRVAEQGSHEALVRAGGTYAELYELQADAYRDPTRAREQASS